MGTFAVIGLGGAIGSMARYFVVLQARQWLGMGFPYGTLAVNALGALVMGFLMWWTAERVPMAEWLRLGLTVGFLGGFTTFSSFSYETLVMLEEGAWLKAGGNLLSNNLLCLGFCFMGIQLARL